MKYLVIGAVLALLFIFIYSRLQPYIAVAKKVLSILRGTLDFTNAESNRPRSSTKTENRLVRCVACGTWIPAERAIGPGTKSAYCSRECLEKSATRKERKLAG